MLLWSPLLFFHYVLCATTLSTCSTMLIFLFAIPVAVFLLLSFFLFLFVFPAANPFSCFLFSKLLFSQRLYNLHFVLPDAALSSCCIPAAALSYGSFFLLFPSTLFSICDPCCCFVLYSLLLLFSSCSPLLFFLLALPAATLSLYFNFSNILYFLLLLKPYDFWKPLNEYLYKQ